MVLVPLAFIGFFQSYFSQFPSFKEIENGFIHVHAFLASLWILLLIAQPILIKNKKLTLHRRLGKLSYVLFPLLILSFVPLIINRWNSEFQEAVFFPLTDSLILTTCYVLAIYHRKKSSKHMRYMIGTAIVFLGPTIGRIGPNVFDFSLLTTQYSQYSIIFALLALLISFDVRHKKKYQPYLFMLVLWVIHTLVFSVIFL